MDIADMLPFGRFLGRSGFLRVRYGAHMLRQRAFSGRQPLSRPVLRGACTSLYGAAPTHPALAAFVHPCTSKAPPARKNARRRVMTKPGSMRRDKQPRFAHLNLDRNSIRHPITTPEVTPSPSRSPPPHVTPDPEIGRRLPMLPVPGWPSQAAF
jgi:hypothetical protein